MLATAFASNVEPGRLRRDAVPVRTPPVGTLAESLAHGAVRPYNAREHIFCEGDVAAHVFRVESGNVCIYRMVPDGRRQVIDFAYPGDIIGLGALRVHAASAQATSKIRVRCIPTATLHEIAQSDPAFGLKLYEAMAQELIAARELLFTISQRTAAERLAAFLLALSRRNQRHGDDPSEIVLPMTRADIADFLGLTIETVSRNFTKFRAEGLIDIEQCILVTILDAKRLGDHVDGICRISI